MNMAKGTGLEIAALHACQLEVTTYILKLADGKRLTRVHEGAEFGDPRQTLLNYLEAQERC